MNTNLEKSKLPGMDIQDVRRRNLRAWLRERTVPQAEKSYFSQLLGGTASFGERAARRIESDYGMDAGYLDQTELKPQPVKAPKRQDPDVVTADEMMELFTAYKEASASDRAIIMTSAKTAAKRAVTKKGRASIDKP